MTIKHVIVEGPTDLEVNIMNLNVLDFFLIQFQSDCSKKNFVVVSSVDVNTSYMKSNTDDKTNFEGLHIDSLLPQLWFKTNERTSS